MRYYTVKSLQDNQRLFSFHYLERMTWKWVFYLYEVPNFYMESDNSEALPASVHEQLLYSKEN